MKSAKPPTWREQLTAEVDVLNDALKASEQDIHKLQKKLADARSRQNALMTRLESAENQVKLRTMYNGDKVREAFSRFDVLERRVDEAQGYADALAIGNDAPRTLGDEIAALESFDVVDAELEAMKKAMKQEQRRRAEHMDGEIIMVPIVVGILFLGLPWLILNHVTKWKTAATLTNDDERMLGEMYDLARRLEDRMDTVERLVAQDNPDFAPAPYRP